RLRKAGRWLPNQVEEEFVQASARWRTLLSWLWRGLAGVFLVGLLILFVVGWLAQSRKAAQLVSDIRSYSLDQTNFFQVENDLSANAFWISFWVSGHIRAELEARSKDDEANQSDQTALGLANLAAVLIRLEPSAPEAWELLERPKYPQARTYLIHRL